MIYLLRHCESLFNLHCHEDDYKEYDSPLSCHGNETAKKLTHPMLFDTVYVSPLQRCIDTLKLSDIKYQEVILTLLVREMKTHISDLLEGENSIDFIAETEEEVLSRVEKFKNILNEGDKSKNVLIVGHADFFWYLTSAVEGGERFGAWLENGEFYEFTPST